MENKLKKIIKNIRLLSFALVLLFLLLLSLQLTVIQISTAYAKTLQKSSEAYPDTPERVVIAFIETGFSSEANEELNKYFPNNDDIKSIRKTRIIDLSKEWGYASDRTHIATGYEIKEVKKDNNKASVIITYKRLGWKWQRPIDIKECRESRFTKDKEGCKILHITNDIQEVTYRLAKPGKFWRIINVYEPRVSVDIAIKELNRLKGIDWTNDDPRGPGPSDKQKTEIEEAINHLEKYLINEKEVMK
ncbi:MAG: hypothetical protein Q8N95_00890 [Desulfobacterales bacterium]|nr:hypothetical protein [Desulfobacterales bacterium]